MNLAKNHRIKYSPLVVMMRKTWIIIISMLVMVTVLFFWIDSLSGPLHANDRFDAPDQGVDLPQSVRTVYQRLRPSLRKRYKRLISLMPSPCGKPHSLEHSARSDKQCRRTPFALNYLALLLPEMRNDLDVKEFYQRRYLNKQKHKITRSSDLYIGPKDALLRVVEFFDYGCPICKEVSPVIKKVVKEYPQDVMLEYKNFPLASHPNSKMAARAALAAGRQNKFEAMHKMLFDNQKLHQRDALFSYARKLKLNLKKFKKAFNSNEIASIVTKDRQEGIDIGLQGTPSIYIGGRQYTDPYLPIFLRSWIEEEIAVNH